MFQPYLADYRYYALFEDGRGMSDVGNAKGLYRSLGVYDEEEYVGHDVWAGSSGLSKAGDRDSYDDYREVTPAEVRRLRQLADDREPAREKVRDGYEGGGFAVFRHEADMVNLRSAYAVVDELLPEQRFAVSLAPFERNGLAGVIALLAARRRAEPVDGHYCFAVFENRDDVVDVDRAHALIRCPASGDGVWETYLREGAWVLGEEPRDSVVLPVGREDAERVIRGRESADARYFDVWQGLAVEGRYYLRDVVRRTGSVDETPDDLGWQHTDVLRRLEPGWWVVEFGESHFRRNRYLDVMMARARRFHGRPHDYQAFFSTKDDIYDFGNVRFLARRLRDRYELEYELWTPDGWKLVSGGLGCETLPISEEEFERLVALRLDERGAGDVTR